MTGIFCTRETEEMKGREREREGEEGEEREHMKAHLNRADCFDNGPSVLLVSERAYSTNHSHISDLGFHVNVDVRSTLAQS